MYTVEKINAQYEADMVRKAQAASEIQSVEETDNVPANDAMPFQQPGASNAMENREDQNSGVINQEIGVTPINEPVAPSVSDPKLEEAAKDSTCRKGALRSLKI